MFSATLSRAFHVQMPSGVLTACTCIKLILIHWRNSACDTRGGLARFRIGLYGNSKWVSQLKTNVPLALSTNNVIIIHYAL